MSCQYMNLTACMTYQLRKWFVHILIHGNYSLIHFNVETGKTCPEVQKTLFWNLVQHQLFTLIILMLKLRHAPAGPTTGETLLLRPTNFVQHGLKPCSGLELYLNSGSLFRVGSQIYIGWECGEIDVMTVIRMSGSHPDEQHHRSSSPHVALPVVLPSSGNQPSWLTGCALSKQEVDCN